MWQTLSKSLIPAIRTAIAAAIYAGAGILGLICSLAIWTEVYIFLSRIGPPGFMLGLLLMLVGGVAFGTAAWLGYLITGAGRSKIYALFGGPGLLYVYVMVGLVEIISNPPAYELEGADIALRASVLLAIYGILVHAAYSRFIQRPPAPRH